MPLFGSRPKGIPLPLIEWSECKKNLSSYSRSLNLSKARFSALKSDGGKRNHKLKTLVPKAVLSPKSSFRLVSNVVVTLHIVLNYNDSDDDAVHRSESDDVWE